MEEDFTLRITGDGSSTLYSDRLKESYHSVNGAVQESRHVFIEAGLQQCRPPQVRIFELGFGTGLNALLSWEAAHRLQLNIDYVSLEAYPLRPEITRTLNYQGFTAGLAADAFDQLHRAAWNQRVVLETGRFSLKKVHADFNLYTFDDVYDLVYFDAFAPAKQPELWAEENFRKIAAALPAGGILVTYCAMGEVRRRMQRSGFTTERLPGPPGKREMLRATRNSEL